jgi:hypothetical protein
MLSTYPKLYYIYIWEKKSYLILKFLPYLNLVIEFLILRIRFLSFIQVLKSIFKILKGRILVPLSLYRQS